MWGCLTHHVMPNTKITESEKGGRLFNRLMLKLEMGVSIGRGVFSEKKTRNCTFGNPLDIQIQRSKR